MFDGHLQALHSRIHGMRITHGGASSHLRNDAAEIHLEARLAGNENAAFALKAIENSRFEKKF